MECCSEAPWPRSAWRFTHPSLNLILCLAHSSSHAMFTKISPPHQTKHETRAPCGECSHNPRATGQRTTAWPPCPTGQGGGIPTSIPGVTDALGDKNTPGQLFLWALYMKKQKTSQEKEDEALSFVYKTGQQSGTSENLCGVSHSLCLQSGVLLYVVFYRLGPCCSKCSP